jgi:hypothetical protein
MVTIRPDRPATPAHAVHEAGNSDGQPAHTTFEPRLPVRLYQQVQMILLDAELQNAESLRRSREQGVPYWPKESFAPEGREVVARAERNMDRTARLMWGAPNVRNVSTPRLALPTGVVARAAPGSRSQFQLDRKLDLEFEQKTILAGCTRQAASEGGLGLGQLRPAAPSCPRRRALEMAQRAFSF